MSKAVDLVGYHLTFDAEMTSSADMAYFVNKYNNGDTTIVSNGELENYTQYSPTNPNYIFHNGALTITALPQQNQALPYTSGLISTGYSFYQNQGYFEIRAKLPNTSGFWPAFWMLAGGPTDYASELDIAENPNLYGKATYFNSIKTSTLSNGLLLDTGVDLSAGYHSYGVMWTATTIQFTFDGQYIGSPVQTPPALQTQTMYLFANLAVGGWATAPAEGTSASMAIDYIRAYSNDPTAPAWRAGVQPISSPDGVDTRPKLTASTTPAPNDFNRDGYSDILFQNDNGAIVIWTQANLAITEGIVIGNPGPTWHLLAVADFNGDGQPDLLLQNNNGAVVDYLMNETTIAAGYNLGNAGPSWHVRGAADFNQDGRADILLQNDNGAMVIWTTNGSSVASGINLGNPGPGWTIEGIADFNGDSQPDILLQNTNGAIVDYLMNGTTIAKGANLGNPGPAWAIAGTGDTNGDGRADILLHNDNGADVVWATDGTAIISAPLIGNSGPAYTGAVAGLDLNGDGLSDLVIQNTDSTLIGYTLNTNSAVTAGANLGAPGIGWHTIGNNPIQFIDGTHGNPNLVATPGPDQFDLTTFTGGLQQITGFNPAQDRLTLSAATFPNDAALQNNEQPYQGGTYIALTPGTNAAALVILGVTPDHLSATNFILR